MHNSSFARGLALLGLFLGLNGALVHAQVVEIECLSFPKHSPEKVELLIGPKKTVEITLQSHALTAALKVPRLAVWKFGKSTTNASGEFQFLSYGQVKPLTAKKQVVLLMRKGATLKDGLNVRTLDGGKAAFGAAQMLFVNMTKVNIGGVVGGQKIALRPGKHVIIKPKADRGKDLSYASLQYPRNGKWRSFFSTNWPVLKEARGLVFIYGERSPRIHSIVDSLRVLQE